MYLNILMGKQAGSVLEIQPQSEYVIANNFEADVYIDFDLDTEHQFILCTSDQSVEFKNFSGLNVYAANDQLISENIDYQLPLQFRVGGCLIGLSNNKDENFIIPDNTDVETPSNNDQATEGEELEEDYLSEEGISFDNNSLERDNSNPDNFEASENKPDNITAELLKLGYTVYDDSKFNVEATSRLKKIQQFLRQIVIKVNFCWQWLANARTKNKKLFYMILIACFFGIFIAVTGTVIMREVHKQQLITKSLHQEEQLNAQIRNIMLTLPAKYSNLKLEFKNKQYHLAGIVSSQTDIVFLHNYFNKVAKVLQFDLTTFDQAKSSIAKILQQNSLSNLKINWNTDSSSIELSGIIDKMERLDDIEISLNTQLPSINNLDVSQIYLLNEIKQDLNKIFSNSEFQNRLTIVEHLESANVSVSGYLPAEQIKLLDQQLSDFMAQYHHVVQVNLNIQNILDALPFKIIEAYNGNPGYIIIETGRIIYVGGSVKGFILSKITPDTISFTGKFPLVLKFSDLYNSSNVESGNNTTLSRAAIISAELAQESDTINKEKIELASLNKLLPLTKESATQHIISEQINKITADINAREHEFNSYNKDHNNQ